MQKHFYIATACLAAAAALCGCQQDEPTAAKVIQPGDVIEFSLPMPGASSRTHYDADRDGMTQMDWDLGDEVVLKYYEDNSQASFKQGKYRVSAAGPSMGAEHKFHAALAPVIDNDYTTTMTWAVGSQHNFSGAYPADRVMSFEASNDPHFQFPYQRVQPATVEGLDDGVWTTRADMRNAYMVAKRLLNLDLKNNPKATLTDADHVLLNFQPAVTAFDISIISDRAEPLTVTEVSLSVAFELPNENHGYYFKINDNYSDGIHSGEFSFAQSNGQWGGGNQQPNEAKRTEFKVKLVDNAGASRPVELTNGQTLKLLAFMPPFNDQNCISQSHPLYFVIRTAEGKTFRVAYQKGYSYLPTPLAKHNCKIRIK